MTSNTLDVLFLALSISIAQCKKKKNKQPQRSVENSINFQYVFIALGVISLIVLLGYLIYRRNQLMRAQKLRSIKRMLQVKQLARKDRPCTMTQMQKDQAIAWFSKHNWILQQSHGKDKVYKIPLQIISVKRKQQPVDGSKFLKQYYDAFYIDMKGGYAKIFGVIMFQKYYPTIIFEKSVSNSKNQNGNYDYRIFDGSLKKGQFQGRWYTTNDTKIQQQREALKEKQKNINDEPVSQKSFSKAQRDSEDSMTKSTRQKQLKGSFKLYHE